MRRIGTGVLAGALLLGACSAEGERAEDQTPYEQLDNAADTSGAFETGESVPVTPVQGGVTVGGPLTATGQFEGVGQNPSPGSITLTEAPGGTRLSLLINGYTANAELHAAVVQGACASPGAVVQAVPQTIRIAGDGTGTMEGVVPVPTQQLLDGSHSVVLTTDATAGGRVSGLVGCAALPAQGG